MLQVLYIIYEVQEEHSNSISSCSSLSFIHHKGNMQMRGLLCIELTVWQLIKQYA